VADASIGGFALGWGSATHPGKRRQINEDAVLAVPGVFLVADGMGGHDAGEVASAMVVEQFAELPTDGMSPVRIGEVATVLETANARIRDHARRHALGPIGTTVVGLVIAAGDGGTVPLVFHVGDSRAYRRAGGVLARLTSDHSEVQELIDAGLLDDVAARRHPQRNVITRSLGYEDAVAVDFSVLAPDPMRVLLCSDGLLADVDDAAIDRALAGIADPQAAADALVAAALAGDARDNVSVIVVDVAQVAVHTECDITAPRDQTRRGWAPRLAGDGSSGRP